MGWILHGTTGYSSNIGVTLESLRVKVTNSTGSTATTTLDILNVAVVSGAKYYIYVKSRFDSGTSDTISITRPFTMSAITPITNGNDYIISGVGTQANSSFRIQLSNLSVGGVFSIYQNNVFNISTLIANKQYSPLYSTTFDLMSDAQIKAQMDLWENGAHLTLCQLRRELRVLGRTCLIPLILGIWVQYGDVISRWVIHQEGDYIKLNELHISGNYSVLCYKQSLYQ